MLLDTNAVSAWAKQDPGFFIAERNDRPWYLPSIVLGEYRFGLINSNKRLFLEQWLEQIETTCEVLGPDAETARIYAVIRAALKRANQPIPYHDIWIAALAIQHGLPVVTRDVHFDRIANLRRIGW